MGNNPIKYKLSPNKMKEELKTHQITMEIATDTHPKKWFEETVLDNLCEYGEGFVASPEYKMLRSVNQRRTENLSHRYGDYRKYSP